MVLPWSTCAMIAMLRSFMIFPEIVAGKPVRARHAALRRLVAQPGPEGNLSYGPPGSPAGRPDAPLGLCGARAAPAAPDPKRASRQPYRGVGLVDMTIGYPDTSISSVSPLQFSEFVQIRGVSAARE